jgi:hypothetical protein
MRAKVYRCCNGLRQDLQHERSGVLKFDSYRRLADRGDCKDGYVFATGNYFVRSFYDIEQGRGPGSCLGIDGAP